MVAGWNHSRCCNMTLHIIPQVYLADMADTGHNDIVVASWFRRGVYAMCTHLV